MTKNSKVEQSKTQNSRKVDINPTMQKTATVTGKKGEIIKNEENTKQKDTGEQTLPTQANHHLGLKGAI